MSKKEKPIDVKPEQIKTDTKTLEQAKPEPFQYGTAPSLMINMVRENRVYRFEMPIGAKLAECVEACNKCVDVVKQMQEESFAKMREAEKKKKEKESKKEK